MKRDASGRVLDGNNQSGSCSSSRIGYSSSSKFLQFFVRNSIGNTKVIHAYADDTVESIHEQIRQKTRVPVLDQGCFYYRGKKLDPDKTLEYYSIQRDSQLELVARLMSTQHPTAWRIVSRLISTISGLCSGASSVEKKMVVDDVQEFINMSYDDEDAFSHNQIFVSAGAAAALVMLLGSPIRGNKVCAEEAIELFLHPLDSGMETIESHAHSVSIILEFCKLLWNKRSKEDPLYIACLNTLEKMLKTIQVAHMDDAQRKFVIQGLSLLVSELGSKVTEGLHSYMNSRQIAAFLGDVRDFIALLIPLCDVIECVFGEMDLLPIRLTDLPPCYIVELETLHAIFVEMLGKIDECLKKMEIAVGRSRTKKFSLRSVWEQYLFILKALNTLSELYEGAEENVMSVLRSRQVALNTLILWSRRSDDHSWILKHKDLTSSESRRHLTMMLLPELKDEYGGMFEMLIDREQILAASFEYIRKADAEDLLGGRLFLQFKNEEATGPGVLREWFCSVCQAICNPHSALFVACPDDNRRFFPNPASDVNPLHLEYFHFCGRVIALSLVYKVQVGILFDRTFFLQLAGATISLEDVRHADPFFYSSCKKILEMDTDLLDSDALGLTFVRDIEMLGSRTTVELCPGGNGIALNSNNRESFVNLLIQDRFVNSVSRQVKKFAEGFSEILCDASLLAFFFRSLEHEDLDRMLHGSDRAICVKDWKAHTKYNGWKETDSHIIWFWKIVGCMSDEQRRVLLFFWTAVKYLPVDGFGGLQSPLYIHKSHNSDELPSAHTCFHRLCLPLYKSKARMQKSLQIITQEHLSCSFGME